MKINDLANAVSPQRAGSTRMGGCAIQRQLTESDCAVWAIKAVCFQLGVAIPPAHLIRQKIEISDGGTSIRDVRDALLDYGVAAQPVQGPCDAIAMAPMPAIAMIQIAEATLHYVVVLEADNKSVRYLDPGVGGGALVVAAQEFASQFTGNLILCERQPNYVTVDWGKEVDPTRFLLGVLSTEVNAAVALAFGSVFQLLILLIGILLLKNFFGSANFGSPNFWFLGGIGVCAIAYMWVAGLSQSVKADVKTRAYLSIFSWVTESIRKSDTSPSQGLRSISSRCVGVVSTLARSLESVVSIPAMTTSLLLFIALIMCFDLYAAGFAIAVAVALPLVGLWRRRQATLIKQQVARAKESNVVGLVCLMAEGDARDEVVQDLPWMQLALCEQTARQDRSAAFDSSIAIVVSRINVFAGLLIGGLQHSTMGIGHTIAIFFLLSIYSSVVACWAASIAAIPERRFHARAFLDFLSDFTDEAVDYSKLQQKREHNAIADVATELAPNGMGV